MKNIFLLVILILVIFTNTVFALPTSQHISVAIFLSKYADTQQEALIYGFLSHAITDYIGQEYVFDIFAMNKNYDYIMIEGLLSVFLLKKHWNNKTTRMAMIGALAPDVIDGILISTDLNRYSDGNNIFPFHRPNNRKPISKSLTTTISILLFSITYEF